MNYPYQDFSYFNEFIRQAAFDPDVQSIKITLYRVAKKSKILKSLINAVKNNKQVTVVIELTARFDETANIEWARTLRNAGVNVHYGIASLKIHAKLCLINRVEGQQQKFYGHIGTGNFNEVTAQQYTDFSLFTANQTINHELLGVFELIEQPFLPISFKHLIVSPYNTREQLNYLIDYEIAQASENKRAEIQLKLNNLVDTQLINKLYHASQAGVKI